MVFSGFPFLLCFLPLLMALYFPCRKTAWRNGVLLTFSLLFYAWGEPRNVFLMIGSTLVNYIVARLIVREERQGLRKLYLTLGIAVSLAALVYFKYAAFFVNSVLRLFPGAGRELAAVTLPIGISFYTFQVLTYTLDVYRGKAQVQKNFFRLLLYVSCFPQLIAGPIVQYADIESQLGERETTLSDFNGGMGRFAAGLAKKAVLANLTGRMAEELLGAGPLSVTGAWLAALTYAMQLYFDFSGYSDMAIGLGKVLGFTYKENFNYPYLSLGVADFWRRWHISLGSFFRDYVYIPLGGSREGTGKTVRNLLIVWTLTGLWHGASWNFVLWGFYYGVLITAERFLLGDRLQKLPEALTGLVTVVLVLVGWVMFYHTDFAAMGIHLKALLGIGADGFVNGAVKTVFLKYAAVPFIGALFCTPVVPFLKERLNQSAAGRCAVSVLGPVLGVSLIALSLIMLAGQSYNPFIYFRF